MTPDRRLLAVVAVALTVLSAGGGLSAQALEFADGLIYNDFYAVTVVLESGDSFTLFDAASVEGEGSPWPDPEGNFGAERGSGPDDEMKYFFWVRRLGATGAVTYPLSFRRIRDIRFTGEFEGTGVPYFSPAVLTLTDGTEQSVLVKSDGFLGGVDEEFGTYALLWIRHDGIARLEFEHDGSYQRCPECGAIFYDDRSPVCPFDGTALVPSIDNRP